MAKIIAVCRSDKKGTENEMVKLSKLPKLKVKWWSLGCAEEETTCDFEQAKDIVFGKNTTTLVFAEGEMIDSYEELAQLAAQNQHKAKETLNVTLLVAGIGGG